MWPSGPTLCSLLIPSPSHLPRRQLPASISNPHPTILLALASAAVSMGAVPLCWAGDSRGDPPHQCFFIVLTVLAMLLVAFGIRAMFLARWKDRTHPSLLMGATAIALGLTAVPLRWSGNSMAAPPHPGFFIAITLAAMLFASSCAATALGRMIPGRPRVFSPSARVRSPEFSMQAFPASLGPDALDDIADTYEGVWAAIEAAHDARTCSRELIRDQADRLRRLADRIDAAPTDDAIRAEADEFDRKARRAARSRNSAASLYIRKQCHLRFSAAVVIANRRRIG